METTFTYTNGLVTRISDPADRETVLEYDAAGNLIRITDPDGTSRSWEYDSDRHITAETDKRGNYEQTFYDFAGRADRAIRKDRSELDFDPVQVQGLYEPEMTQDPVNAPLAFMVQDVESVYVDANGNTRTTQLDQQGQLVSASDEVGILPSVERNDENLVTRSTDARGNFTNFEYDSNGNVISIRDSISAPPVYVMSGGNEQANELILNSLTEEGFSPTLGVQPGEWNGTQANLNDYEAVVLLNNYNWLNSRNMSSEGQTALIDYVSEGGGLVTGEWLLWNISFSGAFTELDLIIPGTVSGFNGGTSTTYSQVTDDSVLNEGLPNSFDFNTTNIAGRESFLSPKDGATVFYESSNTNFSGLVGWDYNQGSVISFSTLLAQVELADPEYRTLFGNAVEWVIQNDNVVNNDRRYTYDPTFNQLTSYTDELGHQTLYNIDPNNGNVLSITEVIGEVGGNDDLITQFTYTSNGLVDTITDALGRITDNDYDTFGRLISMTYAVGTSDEATRQFEYDTVGNQTAIIDENGNRTEFEYDALNRLISLTEADPDGEGPLTSPVTTYTYDADGNLLTTTDPENSIITNEYDVLNRLIQTTDSLNQVTTFTYDSIGNLLSVVDPLGNETQNIYDERYRLIETIDPDGGVTQFNYDLDNNLTSVIDPVNNETTFTYDARNRLISETDPFNNTTSYEYDLVDNLIAQTDRNDRRIEYEYDDIDRLIQETWIGTEQVINYSYDPVSNLTSIVDQYSSLSYTYDNRDRLITADNLNTPNTPHVTLNYTYDDVGNMLSVVDTINGVESGTSNYNYDGLNRLIYLTQFGNNVNDKRVDFAYNALGQYTSISRYSDLTGTQLVNQTNYNYDDLNRLTNIGHNNGTNDVAFYNYGYDASSRITQITDVDGVTDYTYDDRDQLIGAERSNDNLADETYQYDANGNRISSSLHENDYETGTANRLLSDGVYNYDYDNEGNLISKTEIATGNSQEFEWDYRNRLIAVIDKDNEGNELQRVEFIYDALNRRISKTVDTTPEDEVAGVVTHFVYNGDDVHLEFIDNDGITGENEPLLSQRYLHGAGVDQVLAQEDGNGNVIWMLTDHLGTIRDLVDENGALVNHLTYDSFGEVIAETDPSIDTRYLFTGREFDEEIGLYYYRARYYDAEVGRFIGEDPIGLKGGLNVYTYVVNNPLSYIDPLGLDACYIDYQGYPITIPGTDYNLPLGHAGVLIYDPKTGSTRYYEYGRYDNDFGQVKRRIIPDLDIGDNGKITSESWEELMEHLSDKYGKDKPIKPICESDSDFNKANEFAQKRMQDKDRKPYSWNPLWPNHCKSFAWEVINAGKQP